MACRVDGVDNGSKRSLPFCRFRSHTMYAVFAFVFVLVVSFFTHVSGYSSPSGLFWDENYHIPAAQKYIDHVYFMEYHPPLGKLLIALGEFILQPNKNIDLSELTKASYVKELPSEFSFRGVRLFPALFGWLSVGVFYLLMYEITRSETLRHPFVSILFCIPYMCDNGMIMHFRGAMLDSFLIFFTLLGLLWGVRMIRICDSLKSFHWCFLGLCIGLAFCVKLTGAILCIMAPIILYCSLFHKFENSEQLPIFNCIKKVIRAGIFTFIGVIIPVFAIWYIHFALCRDVSNERFYKASPEYRQILQLKQTGDVRYFPIMMRDTIRFFKHDNEGVPKLDVCKHGENGSYPLSWIVGAKTISYRWTKNSSSVSNSDGENNVSGKVLNEASIKEEAVKETAQYLYLILNPVVLLISLFGIVFGFIFLGSVYFYGVSVRDVRLFRIVLICTVMYVTYMTVMVQLERVMYLYHYFPPYVFAIVAGISLWWYSFKEYVGRKDWVVLFGLCFLVLDVLATYWFFKPFTYFEPISRPEFLQRAWFDFWQLSPAVYTLHE